MPGLAALTEIEALLEGKKLMFTYPFREKGEGINIKLLLEDPPTEIDWEKIVAPEAKYMEKGKFVDVLVLLRVMQVFENPSNVGFIGYAAWFN